MHFESEAHYQENHVENMFKVSQKASRKATKSLRKLQRILSSFLLNTKIENRSKDQVFIYNFWLNLGPNKSYFDPTMLKFGPFLIQFCFTFS